MYDVTEVTRTQDALLDALAAHKAALVESGLQESNYAQDVWLAGRVIAGVVTAETIAAMNRFCVLSSS